MALLLLLLLLFNRIRMKLLQLLPMCVQLLLQLEKLLLGLLKALVGELVLCRPRLNSNQN